MSFDHELACVGCGYCCQKVLCGWGRMYHEDTGGAGPCPELVQNKNGMYRCGLYRRVSAKRRVEMKRDLAIGTECCSPLFNDQREAMIRKLFKKVTVESVVEVLKRMSKYKDLESLCES